MNIVNLIQIGDEVKNFEDFSPEERKEIATKLNIQALTSIGYVLRTKEENTQAANSVEAV